MKKVLEKIKRQLRKGKRVILAVHTDPDGDALGSMLGLGMVLEKLGLSVTYYSEDGVPRVYRFLAGAEKVRNELFPPRHFDLAVVVDCSDLSRVGQKLDLRKMASLLINIDHHPDNSQFGDINYVVKTSSVAEQIFDLLRFLKIKLDQKVAECLYVAMITDTGNFRYENTTPKTFKAAAFLLQTGINPHLLTTRVYDTKSLASIKILAQALSHLKFSPSHKVAWTVVTKEMMKEASAKGEDLMGMVDFIRTIDGVEVAILFREEEGKVKINFRSKSVVNVSELAKVFGGGGHDKAAGAALEGKKLEEVEEVVIKEAIKRAE